MGIIVIGHVEIKTLYKDAIVYELSAWKVEEVRD
jgi:hypothetical protein